MWMISAVSVPAGSWVLMRSYCSEESAMAKRGRSTARVTLSAARGVAMK
jgi:hypothetical protein